MLIVVAHPDDESCFSATVYEITHNIGGSVDQLIITNGEGGYRYSLPAEGYYHEPLTTEAVGLGDVAGHSQEGSARSGHYSGHHDGSLSGRTRRPLHAGYRRGSHTALERAAGAGGSEASSRGREIRLRFHAVPQRGHARRAQSAAITALNAVAELQGDKPVVLACQDASSTSATPLDWTGFHSAQHPYIVAPQRYIVDRNVKFGFNNVMDYQIIANWVIAAQKSQGAFQMGVNDIDKEQFAILDLAAPSAATKADQLFRALSDTAAHPVPLRPPNSP